MYAAMDRYLERGCRSLRLFTSNKPFVLPDFSRGFLFYVDDPRSPFVVPLFVRIIERIFCGQASLIGKKFRRWQTVTFGSCVSKCKKYFERCFSYDVKLFFKVNTDNECSEIVEFVVRPAILDVHRLSKDTHVSISYYVIKNYTIYVYIYLTRFSTFLK